MTDMDPFADVAHEPGATKPDPIIIADGTCRRFGGLTAVDVRALRGATARHHRAHRAQWRRQVHVLQPSDGLRHGRRRAQWTFNGHVLKGMSPAKVARAGMVRTFQLTKALNRMTVIENMRLGAADQSGENIFAALHARLWRQAGARNHRRRRMSFCSRFKLYEKKDDYAGSLSGGQRKLLEMARALMSEP